MCLCVGVCVWVRVRVCLCVCVCECVVYKIGKSFRSFVLLLLYRNIITLHIILSCSIHYKYLLYHHI